MIRHEAFVAAKNMKQFLEIQSTPEQFNSWRKSIDSNKDWTEEEKDYLKGFVVAEEYIRYLEKNYLASSDKTQEEKNAASYLINEGRRKMDLLR